MVDAFDSIGQRAGGAKALEAGHSEVDNVVCLQVFHVTDKRF